LGLAQGLHLWDHRGERREVVDVLPDRSTGAVQPVHVATFIEQLAGERTAPTVKARLPQSVISLTGSLSARSYGLTPPRPTPKSAPFDERLAYATGFTLPRGPIRGLQRAFTENERRGIARSILDHLQLCGWRFDHYPPPRGLACSPAGTHASNACACLLP
jgi:hypothetical protein